ncbi:MAG: tetratricopeptide repeat protein [Treponema sp.]|jgi:Ca-activated chloride channel family protein|nr:tetratricopeptide repeat protein [Treponema sp.]
MAGKTRFWGLFWALFLLGGCSRFAGRLLVMEGNFFHSQGLYTRAIASYTESLRFPQAVPYGEYGLALAYFSLNEGNAAQERFAAAEKALKSLSPESHRELLYRIRYNSGVICFEKGDYTGAAEQFRGALELDGSRLEAKRNLELSLLSLVRAGAEAEAPVKISGGRKNETLFEYIREKEQSQWKSREWTEADSFLGPDY